MNILNEVLMEMLHRFQTKHLHPAIVGVSENFSFAGCRDTCSGSCYGSCSGGCDNDCPGGCESGCRGSCEYSCDGECEYGGY